MRAATIATLLCLLLASASAQLATVSTTVQSGSNAAVSFNAGITSPLFTAATNFFGSVSATTSSSSAVTLNTNLYVDISAAISGNLNQNGVTTNLAGGFPIYFTFTSSGSSAGSTVTLTFTPPATSIAAGVQLHLFSSANAGSDGTSAGTYGAVAVSSQTSGSYSYTLNLPLDGTAKFTFGTLALSAFAAGNSGASDATAFSSSNKYLPVAFNTNFNYQGGQQYQVGNSLYVAAQASTSFTVQSASTFTANNQPPASNTGNIGYSWQINGNGNNANTVLQWSGAINGINATNYNTATWVKTTTTTASASSWSRVNSASTYNSANGQVTVTARTNGFSQWSVSGQSGAAGVIQVASLLVVVAAVLSVLF